MWRCVVVGRRGWVQCWNGFDDSLRAGGLATASSFGLLVRAGLTSLILIPIWWVLRATLDMAALRPSIVDLFLGFAGIALIFGFPRYLSDLWRPSHQSRKQAMAQRTLENRLEVLLRDPPSQPPPAPPTRW